MKTKSGALFLTKKEIEALEVIKRHISADMSYEEEGSFYSEKEMVKTGEMIKTVERVADEKEIKKAKLGLEVVDFVLQITK